jgi:hypothetical protein
MRRGTVGHASREQAVAASVVCQLRNRPTGTLTRKRHSWRLGNGSLDRELVYSLFWPTDRSYDGGLPSTIMNWLVTRTMWLQKRYWEPGVGLVRKRGAHA